MHFGVRILKQTLLPERKVISMRFKIVEENVTGGFTGLILLLSDDH